MKTRLFFLFVFVALATLPGTAQTKPATNRPADAVNPKEIRPDQIVDGRWIPATNKPVPTPKATASSKETEVVTTVVETPVADEGGPSTTVILIILAVLLILGGRYVYLIVFRGHEDQEAQSPESIPKPTSRIAG